MHLSRSISDSCGLIFARRSFSAAFHARAQNRVRSLAGSLDSTGNVSVEPLETRRLLSATYFVSNSGADQNPGTISQPFQTIQHAASLAVPGDVVNIRGGTYRETVTPATSGTSGAPITYQAYNNEKVVIDGADPITGWSHFKNSIYQANQPWDLGFGQNQILVDGKAMLEARWPNTTSLNTPTLAQVAGGSTASVWSHHTANVQALEPAGEPGDTLPDRVAAEYNGRTFDVPVSIKDGKTHRVELYVVDYDLEGRTETIQVTENATSKILSTKTVSGFGNGVWLIYDVSGSVTFHLSRVGGPWATISGLFVDPSSAPPPTAAAPNAAKLVGQDTATQGNWIGKYGSQGEYIAAGVHNLPAFASAFLPGTYLVDPNLPSSGSNWAGATIEVAASQGWVTVVGDVINVVGDKLYYNLPNLGSGNIDTDGAIAGNRYFLVGKMAALNSPTEWFRNPSTGVLYLWAPKGDNPALHSVEAKHRQFGFDLDGFNYINVKGITLLACTVSASGSNFVNLSSITDKYLSQYIRSNNGWMVPPNSGLYFVGNNNSLTDSVLEFGSGDGIRALGNNNVIRNNLIHDVDYTASDAAGVAVRGSGNVVDHNTIFNAGRDGILMSHSAATQVTFNKIYHVMLQTSDGSGIYSYNTDGTGSTIAFNDLSLIHSGGFGASGIFLDNFCQNYSIHNNRTSAVDFALKLNPPNHNEMVANNDLIGIQYSVVTSGDFDLAGCGVDNNVFNTIAQIPPTATQSGNVTSGSKAGKFVAGSSLSASL